MTRNLQNSHLVLILACLLGISSTTTTQADIVTHDVDSLAVQQVNLFGVDATLEARGIASYTFDVDANNNTIPGGNSTLSVLFEGLLPSEFAGLGLEGAEFDLFTTNPGAENLTVTGNGTQISLETTFGIRVYAGPGVVGANFFTSTPSLFEGSINGLQDFTGSVFGDPNRPLDSTDIFIGDSLAGLGLPASGTLVGSSFNRTVSAVPEPSSLFLGAAFVVFAGCRRRKAGRALCG